ncbi:MAG: phosphatase PAP2 family protein [Gudongella sp.]|nr:phosphatase PAP2 family protein [Gudongella sp.]
MINYLKKFDDFFIHLINSKIKNKYLDKIMFRVTDLGGAIFTSIFAMGLLIFGNKEIKMIGLEAIFALSFGQIFVQSLKRLMSRERPYKIIKQLHTFGIELRDYSFPSGHTTASFSLATTLAVNLPKLAVIVLLLALVIGMSRIYLGVHYPTDVVAGIILGIFASLTIHIYFLQFVDKVGLALGLSL